MSVTHLSTSDISGGAARAAYRLHKGLQGVGVDSSMFVKSKSSEDETVRQYDPPRDLWTRIQRRWRREKIQRSFARYEDTRPTGLEPFTDDRTPFAGRMLDQAPSAEVINLHWIRGFVDLQAFFDRVSVPVVWTLHDMNAFTGGCHYDADCDKYTEQCGACPQLGSEKKNDLSRQIWERKKHIFSQLSPHQLHIVTPSTWLAEETRKSTLLGEFPVTTIPYGLDTDRFSPRPREAVRTTLGLPHNRPVILFVADSATNRRKGFSLLRQALTDLSDPLLVSIGGETPQVSSSEQHIHLGKLSSDRLLAAAYSAADVFVIPSLEDNLPNTVLESMACGTPVVGFDTGGIPDMVRPGKTGWLVKVGDVRALREAVEQALVDELAREQRGTRAREVIEEEYTLERQAREHRQLYESVTS